MVLGSTPEGIWYKTLPKYHLSSLDRWANRENYSNLGRYAKCVRNRATRKLDRYLLLIEFAYNNNHHANIDMASYEAIYGRKCQSSLCWYELGEMSLLGPDLVKQTIEQVKKIQSKTLTA